MKKILASALAASCAMALATPAQAAITIDGTNFDFADIDGTELTFSIGGAEVGLDDPFAIFLDFTNTLAGSYSFSLTTSSGNVNVANAAVTGGTLGGPLGLTKTFDDGTTEQWALSNYGLEAGSYRLAFNGDAPGIGDSLTGTINFTAVPEPGAWLMMILGFGLLGGVMRRRQEVRVRYNFA